VQAADLVAGVFESKPFGYLKGHQAPAGIIPEIIQKIGEETGLDIKIVVVPYKRMETLLKLNKIDFAIFFRTKKSEKISIPQTLVHKLQVITLGKQGVVLDRFEDLFQYTIGVNRGAFYEERFDKDPLLKKQIVTSYKNQFKMFKIGRIDLVTGTETGVYYNMKLAGLNKSMFGAPFRLNQREVWLQSSQYPPNGDEEIFAKLTVAINKIRENGAIANIYNKAVE
ncbi:MAG: transporter substrate-binding domain-containing protein, partial [Sneathiella sp.]